MKTVLHRSESRGHANYGWLDTHHTFSFGEYHHPERLHFGAIRVLNDDVVKAGRGFGTHPHANMEIVSIPLRGALEHKDSTGREKIIRTGEVQIMSAGTGIQHSEHNASHEEDVGFLQIWIMPDKLNIEPRYDQREFNTSSRRNQLINVVAPDNPDALWINQQAWMYLGELDQHKQLSFGLNKDDNGVYIFVIEGELEVENEILKKRDGLGITEKAGIQLKPIEDCKLLLIETSMKIRL